MFHLTKEGESIRYGINFYRPSDKASAGFKLKYFHNRVLMVRYSKLRKKMFITHIKSTPEPNWS